MTVPKRPKLCRSVRRGRPPFPGPIRRHRCRAPVYFRQGSVIYPRLGAQMGSFEAPALVPRIGPLFTVSPMPAPVIKFYSTGDEYGEFSNFAHFPIRLKGRTWPTTEHYFQA